MMQLVHHLLRFATRVCAASCRCSARSGCRVYEGTQWGANASCFTNLGPATSAESARAPKEGHLTPSAVRAHAPKMGHPAFLVASARAA